MNSTEALHLAYFQWDEEVIRSVIERIRAEATGDRYDLLMPKERKVFWMHIYGAILTLTDGVDLPVEVPSDEDESCKGMFSWWQLKELAALFASTHPEVTFEPHLGRFKYRGLLYTIPRELYRVTYPDPVPSPNKLANPRTDATGPNIPTATDPKS